MVLKEDKFSTKWENKALKNARVRWKTVLQENRDKGGAPVLIQSHIRVPFSSTLTKGQWQARLWDMETYSRLLQVKQMWDPEHIFQCRHCIGDEELPIRVNEQTMPSWRYFD